MDLRGKAARCDEVCSGEGREEVVEAVDVGEVDDVEADTDALFFVAEEIVFADGEVDDISDGDAGWVSVVVFGSGWRDADAGGADWVGGGADWVELGCGERA